MSTENSLNSMDPERGSGGNKEMYDSKGAPRKAQQFEDGEVFWGSEEEIQERTKQKREELHNK